jgi:hypothetical protein
VNDEFGKPFFDGGIVEVSVNEMVYENIENVGSFISGAYNGIIQGWENNLSNQNGFVENSNGKITSAIKLSPDLKDSVIQLRFQIGTDLSGGDLGWKISSISVAVMLPKPAPTMPKPTPTVPKPAPIVPKPMPTVPKPAPIVPKPMPTGTKFVPTVPKPIPTVPKPVPTVLKPVPNVPKPVPTVLKPVPNVPKPVLILPKPMPTGPTRTLPNPKKPAVS